jgi:hypothetical protein
MENNFAADVWAAIKAFSPGALGAAFAALSGPARNRLQRTFEFCGGLSVTVLATEPVLVWFHLDQKVYWSIVAFTIGFAGLSITSKIMETVHNLDLAAIIRDKLK